MKAVIAGGGIGGLAAALALALKGWEVEVLEQAPELAEVGAGVQISPNGMRVLDALGVTPLIEDSLFEPDAIEMRMGQGGRRIFRLPMKGYAARRWGARFVQIHRADLHEALKARLGKVAGAVIRTGCAVTGYVQEKGGASVYIDNGERVFGDLVVGADGIHSVIRAQMLGPDRARFTGNVAWRLTVPVSKLGGVTLPDGGCIWAGPGKHAVTTRIRGGSMANFVGIVEQDNWTEEGWKIPGEKTDALRDFGDWDPVLAAIIAAADQPYRWALHDRPPLIAWTEGPVALLGDAAHPMLPSMAQGAVQALEDAVVLAACLGEQPADIKRALAAYEAARKPRATAVQARSAANLRMFHHRSPLRQLLAYGPIWLAARLSTNFIHARQDWIYGVDAAAEFRTPASK
ncbi:MAG: FAD-dependent monooxygenase [Paracoccaceae bacterium]